MATRGLATVSLAAALVVVVLIVFGSGSTYTLHAEFPDAGGLVTGNQV